MDDPDAMKLSIIACPQLPSFFLHIQRPLMRTFYNCLAWKSFDNIFKIKTTATTGSSEKQKIEEFAKIGQLYETIYDRDYLLLLIWFNHTFIVIYKTST